MSYSNPYLYNFRPVFFSILEAKRIRPESMELLIIDEEPEGYSVFEPADVLDVLKQLAPDLNFLTIYTDRPVYFKEYAETMYEENGLIVSVFSKEYLRQDRAERGMHKNIAACENKADREFPAELVLDFEWEGKCYTGQIGPRRYYIPIHKKPWEAAENLDIIVPIGYNTVIVKDMQNTEEESEMDRFEAAFYRS